MEICESAACSDYCHTDVDQHVKITFKIVKIAIHC